MRLRSGVFASSCLMVEALGVALFLRGFFPVPVRSLPRREARGDLPAEPAPPGPGKPSSPPFPAPPRRPFPRGPARAAPGHQGNRSLLPARSPGKRFPRHSPAWLAPARPRAPPGARRMGRRSPGGAGCIAAQQCVCRRRFVLGLLGCEVAEAGAAGASPVP